MRTPITAAALLCTSLACLTACSPEGLDDYSSQPLPGVIKSFAERAQQAGKPGLLVVSDTDWCRTCRTYHNDTLDRPETQEALSAVVVYEAIDYDDNKKDVQAFEVGPVPTTFLFIDGRAVAHFTGAKSTDELLAWINEHDG
ncbi:MAG: hypothetical protein Tsb0013_23910 [Phycisphaerales bacterium]